MRMQYEKIKVGMKVKMVREIKTGCSIIPLGAVGKVVHKYGGLEILFESRCEHCGFGDIVRAARIPAFDVEVME